MKLKLIITGLCVMLVSGGYAFAHEGHEHPTSDEAMMDEDMAQGQTDSKPAKAVAVGNKVCPVSGDEIPAPPKAGPVPSEKSAMGEPVQYEYNGKIYNLCCTMCVKDFKKDPEKYSRIAEEEVKAQGE